MVCCHQIDILALTETWLQPNTSDSTVAISGFHTIARSDSPSGGRKHGVGFLVSSCIPFVSIECSCPNVHIIYIDTLKCYFVVAYRPPSYSCEENRALLSFLLSFCPNKEVVVLGDFNLPKVDWVRSMSRFDIYDPLHNNFLSCFNELGLYQWVDFPTFIPSGNTLDLILTAEHDRVGEVSSLPPPPGCQHVPVLCDYLYMLPPTPSQAMVLRRDWVRGKYSRINDFILDTDWDFEFEGLDLDGQVRRLNDLLRTLVQLYVPLMREQNPKNSRSRPPAHLLRRRKRSWEHYMQARRAHGRNSLAASCALHDFKESNWAYRNYLIVQQRSYEESLALSLKTNPKAFHKYIRSKKVAPPSIGPLKHRGSVVTDKGSMAEIFVSSFASVFSSSNAVPLPHQECRARLQEVDVSLEEISVLLSRLDVSSSMGPDGVHPRLLKSCPAIAQPLYLIFNNSLRSGRLPQDWKVSEVVPIFKKGTRCDPLNYRPISLTSVCCKTLERAIASQLVEFLESNNVLSDDQYGFRKGRSVEEQLLLTYDSVSSWYDEGSVADVVLFDFAKAFDVVDHRILLSKLQLIGIGGNVLAWLESFLCNRSMYVSVGGSKSSSTRVISGVPQGSVLGPLLFLIHVNYLPSYIRNLCKIFADDLKLYLKIRAATITSLAVGVSSCQRDIDIIVRVAESWGLFFNISKCVGMRFHRRWVDWDTLGALNRYYLKGQEIKFVTSHKDLGVVIDPSLRFHLHVRSVAAKASGIASNFLRSTLSRSPGFMLSILKAHIRPLLEFSSPVWNTGFIGDLRALEQVQRRWTREIEGMEGLTYGERLSRLNLYSVRGRLLRADLILCWKIFHGVSSIAPTDIFSLDHRPGNRGHRFKVQHRFVVSEARRRFFSVRCASTWNSLPDLAVSASTLQSFKAALHGALGDKLFEYFE